MAAYLRPRRGKKATAESQNIILKKGEVFFEAPDAGVGKGTGKIKVGDGTTAYTDLPYFLQQTAATDVANSTISFTENSSTTISTLLSVIATGAKLNVIIGAINKLLNLYNTSITNLQTSFQNGCSTIANAITANGVSTATNASPNTMATNISTVATNKYNAGVTATKVGTATASNVLAGKTFTNSSSVGLSGSMVDRGAWTNTPTSSGNVTIPAGYHNGSGYVNTSTVYNNGYNAGAATGKKYVKVVDAPYTPITGDYWYSYTTGSGSYGAASVSGLINLFSWSNITGGWVPSHIKITATLKSTGKNVYVTYIDSTDKGVFTNCKAIDTLNPDYLAWSRIIYIVPGSAANYRNAMNLFLDNGTGVYFPFLLAANEYRFDVEAWA